MSSRKQCSKSSKDSSASKATPHARQSEAEDTDGDLCAKRLQTCILEKGEGYFFFPAA